MKIERSVFFVSDRTGITSEMLGQSLLAQFDNVEFNRVAVPFVDSVDKAVAAVDLINRAADDEGARPIVFSTLVNEDTRDVLRTANALVLDCFAIFIAPLEIELGIRASQQIGRSHGAGNVQKYDKRIEAVNYTLSHDDGVTVRDFADAEIILVGVSRSGKTPTCLYLALQFGVKAANYPLLPEDIAVMKLPKSLQPYRKKLYGLTIAPQRLHQIRSERRPNSDYAALSNCRYEVQTAEALLRTEKIPFFESTNKSVEELATTIMHEAGLQRVVY